MAKSGCRHCGRSFEEHAKAAEKNLQGWLAAGVIRTSFTMSLKNCPGYSEADQKSVQALDRAELENAALRGLPKESSFYDVK